MNRFLQPFSIDFRSLAAFRIAIGLVLLADLRNRSLYIRAHYTDFGLLPRAAFLEKFANIHYFSFHLANGNAWFQSILFIFAALLAIAMIMGYRTRWVTFASWVMLVSLQNRNPMVLNGGDVVFRVLMFWSIFLPLGARYSLDAAFTSHRPKAEKVCNIASASLLLQVGFLYLFCAILKTSPEWWPNGTAGYYALMIDQFTTPFGKWMLQFPLLLRIGTYFTYFLELGFFFLVFSPIFYLPLRYLAVVGILFLHFTLNLSLELGAFPYINFASMLLFLPSHFWESLSKKIYRPLDKWKIYYDGNCYFCQRSLQLLKTILFIEKIPCYPAQSIITAKAEMERENSWVMTNGLHSYYRFEAFIKFLSLSPIFFPMSFLISAQWIRNIGNKAYQWVASHRSSLSSIFRLFVVEKPIQINNYRLTSMVLIALLGFVLAWNITTIPKSEIKIPKEIKQIMRTLRLDQKVEYVFT